MSIPDDMALQPNYHALLVAIARELPAEKAFAAIGCYGEMRMVGERQPELADEEIREMIEMRESGMTYYLGPGSGQGISFRRGESQHD